jgi:L-aspartate oxidase
LASNSLLEAVVFGRRVAGALAPDGGGAAPTAGLVEPPDGGLTLDVDRDAWRALRDMMWVHAGIVRNAAGLTSALAGLSRIEAAVPAAQIVLLNRLRLARSLVEAALARKTSVGAHYRDDAAAVV